jgi:hypothetical protein
VRRSRAACGCRKLLRGARPALPSPICSFTRARDYQIALSLARCVGSAVPNSIRVVPRGRLILVLDVPPVCRATGAAASLRAVEGDRDSCAAPPAAHASRLGPGGAESCDLLRGEFVFVQHSSEPVATAEAIELQRFTAWRRFVYRWWFRERWLLVDRAVSR